MQESVKQDREKYIGGSDIPVIMNLSPYKSRYDLLLEKAGLKEDSFDGNIYTAYGNELEPKIREYINKSFKPAQRFKEGKHVREAQEGETIGTRAHTDGENNVSILEIKTTSKIYDNILDYKLYLVQLLFYMVETGKESGLLAVYERPDDLALEFEPERLHRYTIERSNYEDLVVEIYKSVDSFKEDLAKLKENPFSSEEDFLPVEVPEIAERILAFEYQLGLMKDIEKKIKSEKEKLKNAMEAAGVKKWKTPSGYSITLVDGTSQKEEIVKVFDEKKFKEENPALYLAYLKNEKKITNGKAGYVRITPPKKEAKDE